MSQATGRLSAVLLLLAIVGGAPMTTVPSVPSVAPPGGSLLSNLPLTFVENKGQWDPAVRFQARRGSLTSWFERDAVTLDRAGSIVRVAFDGTRPQAGPVGVDALPGRFNFLPGEDPSSWRTGVGSFRSIRYDELYAGISVVFREAGDLLEYDLLVDAGRSLDGVVLSCSGADGMRIDSDGTLEISTPSGTLRQKPPTSWQVAPDGGRVPVDCRFRRIDDRRFGFEAVDADASLAMVVDPGLEWSSVVGGNGFDEAWDLAVAPNGDVVITGDTNSTIFPSAAPVTVFPAPPPPPSPRWQFVCRVAAGGTGVVFWTLYAYQDPFVFPSFSSWPRVGLNETEEIFVARTGGTGLLPAPLSYNPTPHGTYEDIFLIKFDSSGSTPLYSTCLGGSGEEALGDMVVYSGGYVALAGTTWPAGTAPFPVTPNCHDATPNGQDGFITWLDTNTSGAGSLFYSTFLGGSGAERIHAMTLNGSTSYVAGTTTSSNFPLTTPINAPQADAYVAAVFPGSSGAGDLQWASIFTVAGQRAIPSAMDCVMANGDVVVGGLTAGFEVFVARFLSTGAATVYANVVLPQAAACLFKDLAVDDSGGVVMCGWAFLPTLPVTPGAFQTVHAGQVDGFVLKLHPSGGPVIYCSYLGGQLVDYTHSVKLAAPNGAALLTGRTSSSLFPGNQQGMGGGGDAFATRFDLHPSGVTSYGRSSGRARMYAGVTEMPQQGSSTFAVTCSGAPTLSTGLLLVSAAPAPIQPPPPVYGIEPWIDINQIVLSIPVTTDASGYVEVNLPLPAGAAGAWGEIQFAFNDPWMPVPPGGGPPLSSSNALSIVVQP